MTFTFLLCIIATRYAVTSIPEIDELDRHGKFFGADGGDDGLEFVAALAVDAHFIALDLGRHLEFTVADEAGDFLGHGAFDALLDLDDLARMAERRDVRVALLDTLEADAAFGELADHHLIERADLEIVFRSQLDLVFLEHNFGFAAFEVETAGQ